jgi:hypothetical protein
VPDSYWPITSGLQLQMGRSRTVTLVSSKDIAEAKKISQGLRQFYKKFFEDFYAKAEEAGRYPWPHEAMAALGRILNGATETEEDWPPQQPDQPNVSPEVFEALLSSRFFQEAYRVACDAHVKHKPGFKKWKPGRKRNEELAETIWKLQAAAMSNRKIQKALEAAGVILSLEGVESYLKKRRRLPH